MPSKPPPATSTTHPATHGLSYGLAGRGMHRFRVRQTYLRDHAAPMIRGRRHRALLLDLALRGMSRRIGPQLGRRTPATWAGVTIDRVSQPELHTLVRGADGAAEDQQREWVRGQVAYLEARGLLRRISHPRRGPHTLQVLRDDGSGELADDPSGEGDDAYVTINGTLFASGAVTTWTAAEVAFYLAAMIGEAMAPSPPEVAHRGDGEWWRAYDWFADADHTRRPEDHIRVPFAKQTLIAGQRRLAATGFVKVGSISRHPATGKAFARGGRRNVYLNRFESRSLELLRTQGLAVPVVPRA